MVRDFWQMFSSSRFWRSVVIASAACAIALAALFLILSALLVALPLAIVAGAVLHLHLQRSLRRQARRAPPRVIDGEYIVISG